MYGTRKTTAMFAAMFAAATLAGCGGDSAAKPKDAAAPPKKSAAAEPPAAKKPAAVHAADHDHPPGPHGGTVFELGGGKYHAEFHVEHPKQQATIYILAGEDQDVPAPVKATEMTLAVKTPSFEVAMKPAPQKADPAGTTSAFVGTHAKLGVVQEFEGSVSLEIDGKPFSGDFKEEDHDHGKKDGKDGKHSGMPAGVGGTPAEQDLFLKPGGIYTEADIKANGGVLPSVKFAGISWPHDDTKPGDKLCPITNNKADARCYWTVNGKRYEFCCTPCLDKFVKWAKTTPEKIKAPEEYIAK